MMMAGMTPPKMIARTARSFNQRVALSDGSLVDVLKISFFAPMTLRLSRPVLLFSILKCIAQTR
jgi:hypothetical protein